MENEKGKSYGNDPGNGGWNVSVSSSVTDPEEDGLPSASPGANPPEEPYGNDPPRTAPGYPAWVLMLATVGVFFGSSGIGYIISTIALPKEGTPETLSNFITYVVSLGITIAFAWWICHRHGSLPARPLSFSLKRTNPTLILWGLILVMVTSMVLEPLLALFPDVFLEYILKGIGRGGWAMMTVVVAAPLLEEILFRGIIQQELTAGYGRIRGVVLASAIFGVIHIIPQQAVNAFFVGIIIGYLYVRSKSLTTPIIIHALNNAISYIAMILLGNKFAYTKDIFGNDTFYWIVYAVCCGILLVAGWNLLRELNRLDKAPVEGIPTGKNGRASGSVGT